MAGVWREIQRTYFYILSEYKGMNLYFLVDYDLFFLLVTPSKVRIGATCNQTS